MQHLQHYSGMKWHIVYRAYQLSVATQHNIVVRYRINCRRAAQPLPAGYNQYVLGQPPAERKPDGKVIITTYNLHYLYSYIIQYNVQYFRRQAYANPTFHVKYVPNMKSVFKFSCEKYIEALQNKF